MEQNLNTIRMMNMIEKTRLPHLSKCLLLILSIFLGSCGYVDDKPLKNADVYRADQLQACKIDVDKLGEIFKQNQEEQIRCLKENFIQYTKYVKTSSSDSVNQNELGDFVRKIFQGQSDSIVKGLSIIFQLNMILLKDEAMKISKGNITPLFELLVNANREAIIITNALQDMGKAENQSKFFEIREVFKQSLERFASTTLNIMAAKAQQKLDDQRLNIKEFIIEAAKKIGNKDVDKELIETVLSLKQIMVGGDKEIISTTELSLLIKKIPQLMTLTFDVYYSDKSNFKSEAQQSKYYLEGLRELYQVFDFNQPNMKLVTVDQILNLAKTYIKDNSFDITKFKPSITALKKRLIGGDPESFCLYDIKTTLNLVLDVNERMYFDYVTYEIRADLMNSRKKITYQDLSPINPSDYSVLSTKRVAELTKNFNQLAAEFKYVRESSTTLPFYGISYRRTKYGFVESSLFRWFAQRMISSYGHIENGEAQVDLKEFNVFLLDMRPILEQFKLWSPNMDTFARNAVLLADLFQNQSNGDGLVNEREATEYITMVISASQAGDDFRTKLKDYCDPGINKDEALYDVRCFNQHFYQTFLVDVNLKKYFPRLNEYVNNVSIDEAQGYLRGIEGFARDINDPKIPMNKRDTILSIGSMINVETTFLRFDTNLDNIIDYNELMEAFKVYRPSIIALAKLKKEQEVFASSIFLYMVSKMEVPPNADWIDNISFFTFHKCVSSNWCRTTMMDPIEAKRLNIGSLLYYLVNSNGPKPANGRK